MSAKASEDLGYAGLDHTFDLARDISDDMGGWTDSPAAVAETAASGLRDDIGID